MSITMPDVADTRARNAEVLRRAAAGESERAIARALGISRSLVWDIKQAAKKAAQGVAS